MEMSACILPFISKAVTLSEPPSAVGPLTGSECTGEREPFPCNRNRWAAGGLPPEPKVPEEATIACGTPSMWKAATPCGRSSSRLALRRTVDASEREPFSCTRITWTASRIDGATAYVLFPTAMASMSKATTGSAPAGISRGAAWSSTTSLVRDSEPGLPG